MQFLSSLFADNRLLTFGAAVAAFLAFAVLILLFVRLLFGNRLRMSGGRGRQQRLGVVDSYDMDRQRQLVLVRRDNTEHLILIGGPNDVLIESAIVRVEARDRASPSPREPAPAEPARIPVPETWTAPTQPELASPALPEHPQSASPPLAPLPEPPAPASPVPAPSASAPVAVSLPMPSPTERPLPAPVTAPAPTPVLEPPVPPSPSPEILPASRDTSKPADIFARIRARGTATAAVDTPPAPPVAETPPLADADFFETEIAKALAPSMRNRTAAPPSLSEPAPVAPVPAEASEPPPADTKPPRAAFRPFSFRRDAAAGEGADAAAAPRTPRPPPPPFFSRMTPKPPKERVEPAVTAIPAADDGAASSPHPAANEVSPHPQPDAIVPLPEAAAEAVVAPTPAPEPVPPAPEPVAAAAEALAPSPESVPAPPASPAEALDPFEEEMARLLGRAPSKNG